MWNPQARLRENRRPGGSRRFPEWTLVFRCPLQQGAWAHSREQILRDTQTECSRGITLWSRPRGGLAIVRRYYVEKICADRHPGHREKKHLYYGTGGGKGPWNCSSSSTW